MEPLRQDAMKLIIGKALEPTFQQLIKYHSSIFPGMALTSTPSCKRLHAGAGTFKNLVIEGCLRLSNAMDVIPSSGTVIQAQYQRFIKEFCKAFPNSGDGIGSTTFTQPVSLREPMLTGEISKDVKINRASLLNYNKQRCGCALPQPKQH